LRLHNPAASKSPQIYNFAIIFRQRRDCLSWRSTPDPALLRSPRSASLFSPLLSPGSPPGAGPVNSCVWQSRATGTEPFPSAHRAHRPDGPVETRLSKVIGALEVQPELWEGSQSHAEKPRGLRGDATLATNEFVDPLGRYSDVACQQPIQ